MLKQVLPNLYTFTGMMVGRVYLIDDPDGSTLIDTSIAPSGKKIIAALRAAGRQPDSVKRILITHAHPDHIGGLPYVAQETRAQVIAHELEAAVIRGERDIPRADPKALSPISRLMVPPQTHPKPSPLHRTVVDGEVISEVMGGLQVIHTPGHAPGHVCYWQPEKQVLFIGDVIMCLPNMRLPIAAFTVDMAENIRSIHKIAALDTRIALFGHGQPITTNAAARLRAFAAKH